MKNCAYFTSKQQMIWETWINKLHTRQQSKLISYIYHWTGIYLPFIYIIDSPSFSLGLKVDYKGRVSTINRMGHLINNAVRFGLYNQPEIWKSEPKQIVNTIH